MKRVLLDTNIYGRIFELGDYELVLANKNKVLAYGNVTIRKELRQTDADVKVEFMEKARNFRILLLSLSDLHNLPMPAFRSYENFKQELKTPLWRDGR